MRTETLEIFEFEELSKEAKEVAIESYRQRQYESGDSVPFFADNCKERAEELGFIEPEFTYSLSWSQGDGLSFSAERYEKLEELFIEVLGESKSKTAKLIAEQCDVKVQMNSGYYCYAAKSDIDLYFDFMSPLGIDHDNIDEIVTKVREKLEDIYMDLCRQLEKDGYAELEYEASDEAITETILCNEYEYLKNGKQH